MRELFADLGRIFQRTNRLVTFRRPFPGETTESASAILVLIVLATLAAAYLDAASAGDPGRFNVYGLSTHAANWSLFAALVVLLCTRSPFLPFARALADFAAISLYFTLLHIFAQAALVEVVRLASMPAYQVWLANLLYGAFTFILALAVLWHGGRYLWQEKVRLAGLRMMAAAMLPLFLIPQQPVFYGPATHWNQMDVWSLAYWYWPSDTSSEQLAELNSETDAPSIQLDYEKVLYDQPHMVDRALDALGKTPKDTPHFYFVAAATDSSQEVFRREALGAKAVFGSQFGAHASSIALINHAETVNENPLANVTNLDQVIGGIGRRMDVENDVLVLFITAHGGKEVLSVNFAGFPLNQMTPERLAKILDDASIRNRVLIISSCYSGSFIPKLANPNTLIMTAASSETTSFGCSNEREWTYFGDALFNHAFRETESFPDAFDKAKLLIETWEAEQGLGASRPQIFVGAEIQRKLEAIEQIGSATAQSGETVRQ